MEKLVGGTFLPPKSWIGLKEFKWEDFFLGLIKGPLNKLTVEDWLRHLVILYLSYAWEIN